MAPFRSRRKKGALARARPQGGEAFARPRAPGDCCGHDHGHDEKKHEHSHPSEHGHHEDEEPEEPDEPEDPDPDLMTPDTDLPAAMGPDSAGDLSDADMDKAGELKMAASEHLSLASTPRRLRPSQERSS